MINKVTLIGHLGKDPEIRHFENGGSVARLTVATSDSYKDKDGNWQNQTEWHNVTAWRALAESAEKYLKKGNLVFVEGKLSTRKYTDSNGVEKYATEVIANTLRSLERREKSDGNYNQAPLPSAEDAPYSSPNYGGNVSGPSLTEVDDLPF
jgi:single-strand DNA-binding protein